MLWQSVSSSKHFQGRKKKTRWRGPPRRRTRHGEEQQSPQTEAAFWQQEAEWRKEVWLRWASTRFWCVSIGAKTFWCSISLWVDMFVLLIEERGKPTADKLKRSRVKLTGFQIEITSSIFVSTLDDAFISYNFHFLSVLFGLQEKPWMLITHSSHPIKVW